MYAVNDYADETSSSKAGENLVSFLLAAKDVVQDVELSQADDGNPPGGGCKGRCPGYCPGI